MAVKHTRVITDAEAASPTPEISKDQWNDSHTIEDSTIQTAMIAGDAVTYAKMQNVSATDKLLGRSSSGAGDVEEIDCTAAGRAILDDASAADQRTTLGLGAMATKATVATGDIDDNAVNNEKLRDSAAYSVIGRTVGSSGDPDDIAADANGKFLGRRADALGFYALQSSDLPSHTHVKADVTDFAHQASHLSGGGDALSGTLDAIAKVTVKKNGGADVASRTVLNFIEGTGTTLTVADNTGVSPNRIDITVESTPAGGGTLTDIQEGGVAVLEDAVNIDFDGEDFNVANNDPTATVSIHRNAANGIAGLDASGDLAKTEQHPSTAYTDAANDFGTNVQTVDKIEIDDTDASPVADRRIENIDGLIRAMSTADAEGRHISRASLEQIKDAEVASDAAIAKSKISTSSTFVKADLPSTIAYEDEANDFGTNIQRVDHLRIDDTDASPVADRKIAIIDGLLRVRDTSDAEGRNISRASLEQIKDAEVASDAAIAYTKLALTGSVVNADLAGSIDVTKLSASGGSEGQIPKITGGVVAWGSDDVGSGGTGATTGEYNVHDHGTPAVGNGTTDDTAAIKGRIATASTYGMTTLSSQKQYRVESTPRLSANGAWFRGKQGRLKLTTSWSASDGDAVLGLGTEAGGGTTYKDQRITELGIDFNSQSGHPHGISNHWACKSGAGGTGSDVDAKFKGLILEKIFFEGHSEAGKSCIYLRNLENGCVIRDIRAESIISSSGTPTSIIKIEDIGSGANHGNFVLDGGNHLSSGSLATKYIHLEGNAVLLNRTAIKGQWHTFYNASTAANNQISVYFKVSSGNDLNNRGWELTGLNQEDVHYGLWAEAAASCGLGGINVHDNGFENKDPPTDATFAAAAKGITFEGAGEFWGVIHDNTFLWGQSGSTGHYVGIDLTNLNVDANHEMLIHDNFFYERAGSTTAVAIRGVEGQDNVLIYNNPGYNPVGIISNAWKGTDLYNEISGGNAYPTSATTYTNRNTRKRVTIGVSSGSTTVTAIEVRGIVQKQDSNGTSNKVAGEWVLEPGDTIKVTHGGSTNQFATVYCQ